MNQHSPLDDQLARALRDQASYAPSSLALDDVRSRARRIRRNRAAVAGVGIAAVALAVAGPALLLGGGADRSTPPVVDSPSATATASASQSETATEATPVDPDTPIELSLDAPAGDAPRAVWAAGSTIHLPGGDTIDLRASDGPTGVWAVEQLDDSVVVVRYDESDYRVPQVLEVIPTGSESDSASSTVLPEETDPLLVGSTDHTLVAYVDAEGQVVVLEDGGATRTVIGAAPGTFPEAKGVTGSSCAAGDCVVLIETGENDVFALDAEGGSVRVPGAMFASDASPFGYLGITEFDDFEGALASGLIPTDTSTGWQQGEQKVKRFAPGGRYVSATEPNSDGPGGREVAILDADDGSRVALFELLGDSGAVPDMMWEDDEHLLALVYVGDEQAILRLGVDGSMERASDILPSDLLGDGTGEDVPVRLGR